MTRQYVSQLQYVTADPPERHRRSGTPRQWWILATAGVAQLMVILDASIVNIALPSAQRTLGFADYAGNRQYISLGNLAENPHAFLFAMDYGDRRRVMMGRSLVRLRRVAM